MSIGKLKEIYITEDELLDQIKQTLIRKVYKQLKDMPEKLKSLFSDEIDNYVENVISYELEDYNEKIDINGVLPMTNEVSKYGIIDKNSIDENGEETFLIKIYY